MADPLFGAVCWCILEADPIYGAACSWGLPLRTVSMDHTVPILIEIHPINNVHHMVSRICYQIPIFFLKRNLYFDEAIGWKVGNSDKWYPDLMVLRICIPNSEVRIFFNQSCLIFVSTNRFEIRENSEFEILNSDKWYAHLMISQIYQIPKSDFFFDHLKRILSVSFLSFWFAEAILKSSWKFGIGDSD